MEKSLDMLSPSSYLPLIEREAMPSSERNETKLKGIDNMAKAATATAPATNGVENASTKTQKSYALYITLDGEGKEVENNSPVSGAKVVRMKFANGVTRDLDITSLSSEITNCAVQQGLVTRLQRSYQNKKEVDECVEATDETIADLKNGVWIEPKTGAPRATILAQAIKRTLEANKEEVSDERFQAIIVKLKNADFVEKALKNKQVLSAVEDIKFENAKARRDEARKAAKDAQESLDLGI
jgi:hypothetical protein